MNQAIQFVDRFSYNDKTKVIEFDAIVSGMIVKCCVSYEGEDSAGFIEQNRFDLEEQATELIAEEAYNELGEIWLS